ncbi:hypothetical protein GCM10010393_27720 [Streptomyces gobitricini]|uniref:Uncharacterized protein n=1 Tax=Streptomyces gobitricini TaxID=68211 RepID=A0ABN3M1A6_9ACTN
MDSFYKIPFTTWRRSRTGLPILARRQQRMRSTPTTHPSVHVDAPRTTQGAIDPPQSPHRTPGPAAHERPAPAASCRGAVAARAGRTQREDGRVHRLP